MDDYLTPDDWTALERLDQRAKRGLAAVGSFALAIGSNLKSTLHEHLVE